MIAAGKLDRQITIKIVTVGGDDFSAPTETLSDLATVWAEKRDLRGREFYQANAENAEIETVFRIRWRSDVSPLNRIAYAGRDYDIVSVAEIGRREGLEIMAKARAEG
jgi:SPP1 family predicted phage head-tail adaptor